ncbi:Xylulose kinase [Pleomorphomonas sp. T1.2MG-36]|uniref:FGGY-family carbohydrate kinase n=1 Tax=Pleomorphomonas sp. T1.2MG-36 TaxID=3041167 RepID=UPI002477849D|nr:FGGY family carbohydrate kinase [Pleomorphomonas sp. T1.2MG-36]CAI9409092.1 Xylulose kinase [Pleomorphomonas sp. T1.2MG-36]
MSELFCGIDVGSTNIKVILVDDRRGVIARRHRPTPRLGQDHPPARAGDVEPHVLIHALEDMIVDAWQAAAGGQPIAAIAAAGVGEDGFLVDAGLRPLTTAIAWFDSRAETEATWLASACDRSADTGLSFEPTRTAAKWLWLARHQPMEAPATWIALTDYPAAWWAGETFMSETLAARTACYDISGRAFLPELLLAAQAPTLPPVRMAGEIVGQMLPGRLTRSGAATTATRLVAGGHDHPVAASVADLMSPGAVVDSLGTAEVVYAEAESPAPPRPGIVRSVPVLHRSREARFKVFEFSATLAVLRVPTPGGDLLGELLAADHIPLDNGARTDMMAPQDIAEALGGADPQEARRIAARLLVAATEVTADILDDLAASGIDSGPLYATGGWSRSDSLMRLRATALNRPIRRIGEPELAAFGAALIAGARPDLSPLLKVSEISA